MSWKVYRELGEIIRSIPLVNIRPEATEGAFNKNASVSIKDVYNMRHALHCSMIGNNRRGNYARIFWSI